MSINLFTSAWNSYDSCEAVTVASCSAVNAGGRLSAEKTCVAPDQKRGQKKFLRDRRLSPTQLNKHIAILTYKGKIVAM
jgi:hypothetical protein